MEILKIVLALIIPFLSGSLPTALLMGKAKGIDIRKVGSGNVGATNAWRTLGAKFGITCLLIDMLKGAIPVVVLSRIFPGLHEPGWLWGMGLLAIAGHMFSPFLNFKGGKGVATSVGVILAIATIPVLLMAVIGITMIVITRYVSLASVTGSVALPWLVLILGDNTTPQGERPWLSFSITLLLGLFIIWKHRTNIQRLLKGTENKIGTKKPESATHNDAEPGSDVDKEPSPNPSQ